MDIQNSFPSTQKSATAHYSEPIHSTPLQYLNISILSSHALPIIPRDVFLQGLPTGVLYEFLNCPQPKQDGTFWARNTRGEVQKQRAFASSCRWAPLISQDICRIWSLQLTVTLNPFSPEVQLRFFHKNILTFIQISVDAGCLFNKTPVLIRLAAIDIRHA